MKLKLDPEEKELLESLDRGEWKTIPNFAKEKKKYQLAARNTFSKIKRVNLRLTQYDFEKAHVKALEEGIPYQTLLSSVIHKYLVGRLVEKGTPVTA